MVGRCELIEVNSSFAKGIRVREGKEGRGGLVL